MSTDLLPAWSGPVAPIRGTRQWCSGRARLRRAKNAIGGRSENLAAVASNPPQVVPEAAVEKAEVFAGMPTTRGGENLTPLLPSYWELVRISQVAGGKVASATAASPTPMFQLSFHSTALALDSVGATLV